jgi:hypothetical protein
MPAQWGLNWAQQVQRARLEWRRQVILAQKQIHDQRSQVLEMHHNIVKDRIAGLGTPTAPYGIQGPQDVSSHD